jgi:peptidoglycan/xylan/chitin deacetylase (PgdA/CDA1 family)
MGCGAAKTPAAATTAPQLILKLDDAWFEQGLVHPGWLEVFAYLNERNIVATIGLVGGKTEDAPAAYYDWLRSQAERGHEIWNHGWCHCKPGDTLREFRGTGYDYQLDQLQKTQAIAKEKMAITLTSFGAPYNSTDEATERALAAIPELTVWMYPHEGRSTEKIILPRIAEVNIEYPVHQPDFARFREAYLANLDKEVLIIQGHPRSWHDQEGRMAEFRKIIEFLRQRNTVFTTPARYAAETKGARTQEP